MFRPIRKPQNSRCSTRFLRVSLSGVVLAFSGISSTGCDSNIQAELSERTELDAGDDSFETDSQRSMKSDVDAPYVKSVTSPISDGLYGASSQINLRVNVSRAVTVSGAPELTLNSGGRAVYDKGSGSDVLDFLYTVGPGEEASELDVEGLRLEDTTIKDDAGIAIDDAIPPGAETTGSLAENKNLTIDGLAPSVVDVSSGAPDTTYKAMDTITLEITFDEVVFVDTSDGTPTVKLDSGGVASYASGDATNSLVFLYEVNNDEAASDLDTMGSVSLNGGVIHDSAGNTAVTSLPVGDDSTGSLTYNKDIRIDAVPPVVENVTSPAADSTYDETDTLTLELEFSEPVFVDTSAGTPTVKLDSGGSGTFESGNGTNTLHFSYDVSPGDTSSHLDTEGVIDLNDAIIQDDAGNRAETSLPIGLDADGSLANNKSITINSRPVLETNQELTVSDRSTTVISSDHLKSSDPDDFAPDIIYTLESPPANGDLEVSQNPLSQGDSFTQAAIADGELTYSHSASNFSDDAFQFSVKDKKESFAADADVNSPATFSLRVEPFVWEKQYNGNSNAFMPTDEIFDIAVDSDDKVYVAGWGDELVSSSLDSWVKKLDADGNLIWERQYSPDGGSSAIYSVTTDSNDNVYLAGYGNNLVSDSSGDDWWLKKLNASGNLLWEREYDGNLGHDYIRGVAVDSSDNVYLAGYGRALISDSSYTDWWIKKLDSSGNELWEKQYGSTDTYDQAYAVATDSNDDVYIGGYAYNIVSESSGKDGWLKKLDSSGSELWEETYDEFETVETIAVNSGDDVYLGGYGYRQISETSGNDWWIKKLDSSGSLQWERKYDGNGGNDYIGAIAVDSMGHVFLGGRGSELINGSSSKDWWVKKLSSSGSELWDRRYDGNEALDGINGLAIDSAGYIYLGGEGIDLVSDSSYKDWWLVKIHP